jgi:hypothetical protein
MALLMAWKGSDKAFAKFDDVPVDHANAEAIQFAQTYKIVNGYPDGTFRPENPINRAELVKIMVDAQFGFEEIGQCIKKNSKAGWTYMFFRDVPIDAWFAKYLCVAKMGGVVGGYPDGSFRPAQEVTFAEAAKIIAAGFKMEVDYDPIWYKPYVKKMGGLKAIPMTIGTFDQKLTRGEMAEMVYRLKKGVVDKGSMDYSTLEAYSEEWNTVRSPKAGFTMSAPIGWNVRTEKLPDSIVFYSDESGIADNGCGLFQKTVNQQDLMQWYRSYYQNSKASNLTSPEAFSTATLNGNPSIEANSVFSFEKTFTEIYLLHQNNIYQCRYPDSDPADPLFENHFGLYQKVASTFRFTSADSAQWETYRNARFGYSISHPSDWKMNTLLSEKNFTRRGLQGSRTFIGGETSFSKDGKKALLLSVYQSDPKETAEKFLSIQGIDFLKKTNTRVGKLDAVRLDRSNGDEWILVKSGERMFVFNLLSGSDKEMASKIIQSFALGSTPVTASALDSTTWRTYENGEYGFTVNVPADWSDKETDDKNFEQEIGFSKADTETILARIGALAIDPKTYLGPLEKDLNAKKIKEVAEVAIGELKGSKTTYQDLATNDTFSVYLVAVDDKTFALRTSKEFEEPFVASFSIGKIEPAWKTYKNETYGFSLAFNEIWKGYKVVERKPSADKTAVDYLYVCVPTASAQWSDLQKGYFCPFSVTVIPADKWESFKAASEPLIPVIIGKNISYVFTYLSAQDAPEDGAIAMGDIKKIVSGFKAVSKECTDNPEPTDIGRLIFPIAPKYSPLAFLGELFTASDCGSDRMSNVFGIKGDEYILGSALKLAKNPIQTLIDTLKSIGYACASVGEESACRQWNLEKVVKTESVLMLKPFMEYFESNSCVNCG